MSATASLGTGKVLFKAAVSSVSAFKVKDTFGKVLSSLSMEGFMLDI